MKRRKFLQSLGVGTAVVVTLPHLLTEEVEKQYSESLSDIPDFPGIDGESFYVSFKDKFKKGDILTYDPEFGEQIIVVDNSNFPEHKVKFITNDRRRYYPKEKLSKGTVYYKISYLGGEASIYEEFDNPVSTRVI